MTKVVSQSASRALGLLIAKDKAFGGVPFQCIQKCYKSLVQSVFNYSSELSGTRSSSWVNAVQNRACRYYLGLGKYAPNQAINGEIGWKCPEHLQWLAVTRRWCRMLHIDDGRLAKQVFAAYLTCANSACKKWFFRVLEFYSEIGHDVICRDRDLSVRIVLTSVDSKLLQYYET